MFFPHTARVLPLQPKNSNSRAAGSASEDPLKPEPVWLDDDNRPQERDRDWPESWREIWELD